MRAHEILRNSALSPRVKDAFATVLYSAEARRGTNFSPLPSFSSCCQTIKLTPNAHSSQFTCLGAIENSQCLHEWNCILLWTIPLQYAPVETKRIICFFLIKSVLNTCFDKQHTCFSQTSAKAHTSERFNSSFLLTPYQHLPSTDRVSDSLHSRRF